MIQTTGAVVSYALKKLSQRRKPTVISGFMNRFMGGIHRIHTRKGTVKTMSGMDF